LRLESMYKRSAIVGLILFAVGAGAFGWVTVQERNERRQQEQKRESRKADLNKLDEAFGDKLDKRYFDGISLEEKSQQDLDRYRRRAEKRELILSVSGPLALTGGAILGWSLLLGTARLLMAGCKRMAGLCGAVLGGLKSKTTKQSQAGEKGKAKRRAKAEEEEETEAEETAEPEAEKTAQAKKEAKAKAAKKARAAAKAKAEARRRAKAKAEKQAEAEAAKKARAEAKAKAKAEKRELAAASKRSKAEAKAQKRAEVEAARKVRAEAKAKAKAEKRALAVAKKKAKAEAKARARAERIARGEAAEKARMEEQERLRVEAEAKARAAKEEQVRAAAKAIENQNRSGQQRDGDYEQGKIMKYSKVLKKSGWQNAEGGAGSEGEQVGVEEGDVGKGGCESEESVGTGVMSGKTDASASGEERMAVLLADADSVEVEEPLKVDLGDLCSRGGAASSDENSGRLEETLKAQGENLEKQFEEFRQMTQSVQQAAIEHSKPVEASIKELAQQVSAIREYAAHQQERVKKLQDGYDWNIIRNFCLRLIRCIDNLENRIEKLSRENIDTTSLEEIKDELVFALESNGVEQFKPEINSDYRGQEKSVEAVKDKEECSDATLAGKIAKVVRPGYHYLIDEENVKVVRPAQVKLFGQVG